MLVTALVTPFSPDSTTLQLEAWRQLVDFQLEQGAGQVLLFGTTGEGPSLRSSERAALLDAALEVAAPEQLMVGLGSGRPDQVLVRARDALSRGVRDLLLVDCPYSGASSGALRTRWYGPLAEQLPEARLFPYAVPGRTGTELLPDDLARLAEDHPNVVGVKDATGRLARMTRVRELCGEDFLLYCGDDPQLRGALLDPTIRAQGACSVLANVVPAALRQMVDRGREGSAGEVRNLANRLEPLMGLISFTAQEPLEVGGRTLSVPQRVRNPVPLKALLDLLGFPTGGCRAPLGPLGEEGRRHVAARLGELRRRDAELLAPFEAHFGEASFEQSGELVGPCA